MFKSVFTKYVAAFMLIIFVSFFVLSVILVSNTSNNSIDMKRQSVSDASEAVGNFIAQKYNNSATVDFARFIYYENIESDISVVLNTVSDAKTVPRSSMR